MNIQEAIAEVQQPRSRYQLVHFVIGQHDTPEMRFYQLCLELQDMGHKLRLAKLGVRKGEVEIRRLLETGDELDAIEAEEKQVELEYALVVMHGAEREMAVLQDRRTYRSCLGMSGGRSWIRCGRSGCWTTWLRNGNAS